MDGLTVGRIVHYVVSESDAELILQKRAESGNASCNLPWVGQHYPAIVVAVFENEYGQNHPGVNLQVFMDGNDSHWVTSRKYSEDKEPGTWHWIEKA